MAKEPLKHAQLPEGKQWWLGLKPGELPEHIILTLLMDIPPDYFRKELDKLLPLSGQLAEQLNTPDEYLAYKGEFRGHEVGLVYHGSGSFSISTALEELARLGVKTVVRVGNSGGFQEQVRMGDMVVTSGAIRAERMLLDYVPLEYPAVADRRLAECLIKATWETGATCHEGLTLSVASFYPGSGFETAAGVLDETVLERVHLWQKVGALNVDAETSTVLVMSRLFGMRGGALLGIGNHLISGEGGYLSGQSVLARTALRGLQLLAEEQV
jgi:uridine phosphorylase